MFKGLVLLQKPEIVHVASMFCESAFELPISLAILIKIKWHIFVILCVFMLMLVQQ